MASEYKYCKFCSRKGYTTHSTAEHHYFNKDRINTERKLAKEQKELNEQKKQKEIDDAINELNDDIKGDIMKFFKYFKTNPTNTSKIMEKIHYCAKKEAIKCEKKT